MLRLKTVLASEGCYGSGKACACPSSRSPLYTVARWLCGARSETTEAARLLLMVGLGRALKRRAVGSNPARARPSSTAACGASCSCTESILLQSHGKLFSNLLDQHTPEPTDPLSPVATNSLFQSYVHCSETHRCCFEPATWQHLSLLHHERPVPFSPPLPDSCLSGGEVSPALGTPSRLLPPRLPPGGGSRATC